MAITTKKDGRKYVRVRYRRGTCVDGVDYGPDHVDEPVDVPAPMAKLHVEHLQKAVYVEEEAEVELPFQPSEVTVGELAGELSTVSDPEIVARLQELDERTTAQEHYIARREELDA